MSGRSALGTLVLLTGLWTCGEDGPVDAGVPTSVDLSAAADTLTFLGETTQLTATVRDGSGNQVSGVSVTWSSSDPAVVAIDGSGVATAASAGSTWVRAAASELTDSVELHVVQVPAFLSIEPELRRFEAIGEERQYEVTVTDQGGAEISELSIAWATDDTDVVSVTSDGLMTAVGNGVADVAVDIGGDGLTLDFTVAAPVVFRNATVIPMTFDGSLGAHDVVTREGEIVGVGPTGSVALPEGSFEIDATGLYLMPGLTDTHVHPTCATSLGCFNDFFLYLANGVTTVRTMWGSPFQLRARDRIAAGERLGPTLFVASPGMDGPGGTFGSFDPPITTVAEARSTTISHVEAGYDFIKTYNQLSEAMLGAIHEEAAARGVRVIGHKPFAVPAASLATLGHFTSEHLLEYEQETTETGSIWTSEPELDSVRALAATFAAAGMAATPTTAPNIAITSETATYASAPAARYVSPGVIDFSTNVLPPWSFNAAQRDERLRRQRDIMGILKEEGVPILLGTDAGVRWVLPGFSIHTELRETLLGGLTPYETLLTGTVVAARYLEAEGEFGVIQAGTRADLLLLEADPLVDVANVAARVGVMVRGVWLPEGEIQSRLEAIAQQYGR